MPQIYDRAFEALDLIPEERAWLDDRTRELEWWLVPSISAIAMSLVFISLGFAIILAFCLWAPPELARELEGIMGWAAYLIQPLLTCSTIALWVCGNARQDIHGEIINFYLAARRARENRD